MAGLKPAVVRARVTHARRVPVANSFAYGADYLLLSEAELEGQGAPRLFSYGRANLVSLYATDHGLAGASGPGWVRRLAAEHGIGELAEVALLAHPRVWGYVFNPVSFWLMLDGEGVLRGVLAEVHNTYGDRHAYLCRHPDGAPIGPHDWLEAEKHFHVSPFFDIRGRYRFRFVLDGARVAFWIRYDDGQGGGLMTALTDHRRPFTDGELLRTLARSPLGAAKTSALIHWQALRLHLKGLRFRPRPAPPGEPLT